MEVNTEGPAAGPTGPGQQASPGHNRSIQDYTNWALDTGGSPRASIQPIRCPPTIICSPTNGPTRDPAGPGNPPITFREGDRHAQPGEQPIEDRAWARDRPQGPWDSIWHGR
ncbi:uncharacterized protein ASPGLDRAFT_52805 [Aspergillus glaucus CBS 516.65]|uniref:Uncharacterized protein n=1 Tax=Aspergillus glaucus CBS 516.65 TaxID=1160497 RepID=A0A1L9V614_ASPGL|nr:hypothetical protein ASPGLDRAFT_52805 [Aspergillus glaucus CBS 516.65]OJJ79363.1 hypothetical protein ASPGLDRAFT_52805 [Aspergillus glaucus CBS 516.65]